LARILYAVSPIGLGHASRAAAVGVKLKEKGLEAEFATGGNAVSFLKSYGFTVHDIVTEPTPSERNGTMRYPALWYIRYWSGYRSTKSRMLELMGRLKPELVVGDEEFSSVSLALEGKIKHAMVSDELELGFARSPLSRYIEHRVSRWYTALQESVSNILVPDFGSDYRNVHFMSPVVRTATADRRTVVESLGLSPDSKMILLSASGSGIGEFLLKSTVAALERLKIPDAKLVVTGLTDHKLGGDAVYLGVYRDNQNLVAAADLVISTAGKSTIDEALNFGSPIIVIPIKNHSEQERNAKSLGFSHDDISRLHELIPKYLGQRTSPKTYPGADSIAAYLGLMMRS
jgi:UDP-N-acetylglucosamine--N-acetylmuramyl-(pentapeptide) pyrophosphoryl-undecaprenol N-acetylglucosamine transferase